MRRCLLSMMTIALSVSAASVAWAANPVVVMETSVGTLKIELLADKSSDMVDQFLIFAKSKFYDGTIFHSVQADRAEGGRYTANMQMKPVPPPNSSEIYNGVEPKRGTLAMVKSGDDGWIMSEFMINLKDNSDKFMKINSTCSCVFGQVVEGMDVLKTIETTKTAAKGRLTNVPTRPIIIKSVRVSE
jgi:cyclophilin family peptidyl-prolyl cis-trans isomerase